MISYKPLIHYTSPYSQNDDQINGDYVDICLRNLNVFILDLRPLISQSFHLIEFVLNV